MTARPHPPTAAEPSQARKVLLDHLDVLREAGRPVPCQSVPLAASGCWTAEDESEQRVAARLCLGCEALAECREYGLGNPKEHGVYGAVIDAERRPASGRARKTATKESAA